MSLTLSHIVKLLLFMLLEILLKPSFCGRYVPHSLFSPPVLSKAALCFVFASGLATGLNL